jgi:signal peptidase I
MYDVDMRSESEGRFIVPFEGFSMYPFLRPGDRLVIRKDAFQTFKVGSIILFRNGRPDHSRQLVAHRVIRIMPNGRILTKGDNLLRPDPELEGWNQILGQVVMILRRERMITLTRGGSGFAAKWIAILSRNNLSPGILALKMKAFIGIN